MQSENYQISAIQQMIDSIVYEQRMHARQPVSVQGGLLLNDKYFYVEMVDLSKSGAKLMLVNDPTAPEARQPAILYLAWPFEIDSSLLCVETTIIRVQDNEIAVHFNHVPF